MQQYRAVIVDDEPLAVARLKRLLQSCNDVVVADVALNGEEGVATIEKHHPDLVFLDIEMPLLNGFELLRRLSYMPKVIFTTAYEEHAVKAFEENSIDYLLKPVSQDRLDKALQKLKRLDADYHVSQQQLASIIQTFTAKKQVNSLPVKIGDKILLIKPEQISYLEAKDKYVYIVTDENVEYLTDFTLTSLEEKLPHPFLRVHRAFIINSDKIKEVHRGDSGTFTITMKDRKGSRIYTGRSYADSVKRLFEI